MSVDIWAARTSTGTWINDHNTGWDYDFMFEEGLPEILEKLGSIPEARNNVRKLGIVAHGDQAGLVQLKPDLTPDMITAFRTEIAELGSYILAEGKLIFYACAVAANDRAYLGDLLLNRVSTLLPGRYVIGFEVQGRVAAYGQPNLVGRLTWGNAASAIIPAGKRRIETVVDDSGSLFLSEYSWFAKWSYQGKIVRIGLLEQGDVDRGKRLRKKNVCAFPGCKGHREPNQRCKASP